MCGLQVCEIFVFLVVVGGYLSQGWSSSFASMHGLGDWVVGASVGDLKGGEFFETSH